MNRLLISCTSALLLFETPLGAQQMGLMIGGNDAERYFRRYTLGKMVSDCDRIAIWRVRETADKNPLDGKDLLLSREVLTFRHSVYLKGGSKTPGDPESEIRVLVAPGNLSCLQPSREAVVFFKENKAVACFGSFWLGLDGMDSEWYATRAESDCPHIFSGFTEDLIQHVRDLLAGKEVVITAEKQPWPFNGERCFGEQGRTWRVKASTKLLKRPRTVHSPDFVGWGAGEGADAERMVERLNCNDPCLRILAAQELRSLGPKAQSALPALWKLFADSAPRVRIAAAEAALQIDPDDRLPLLVVAFELSNDDSKIQMTAVRCVGRLGERALPILPQLVKCIKHERSRRLETELLDVMGEVVSAASPAEKQEIARAVARLLCCSDSDHEFFSGACVRLLLNLGPDSRPAFPVLKEMIRRSAAGDGIAAQILIRYAPDGLEWLVRTLSDPKVVDKTSIITALGEVGPKARIAIPALVKLLNELEAPQKDARSRPGLRWRTICTLADAIRTACDGDASRSFDNPFHVTDNPLLSQRWQIAEALLRIDRDGYEERIIPTLLDISSRGGHVGQQARWTLSNLGVSEQYIDVGPNGRPFARYMLMKSIRDPDHKDRAALNELIKLGPAPEVVPELWRLAERDDSFFRVYLIYALWKLDPPHEFGQIVHNVRPRLLNMLKDFLSDEQNERGHAMIVIGMIGPSAAPLVPTMCKCLVDANRDVKLQTIEALRAIGPGAKAAIPDLLPLVDLDDSALQRSAIETLCRIGRGHPVGVQRLIEWCETQDDTSILTAIEPADLGGRQISDLLAREVKIGNSERAAHAIRLLWATDPEAAQKLGIR